MKLLLTAILVSAVAALAASPASASPSISGPGLTKVERQLDGTVRMEGSFTWQGCPDYCNWLPIVTLQPSLPSYTCRNGDLFASDPNIKFLWNPGGLRFGNGPIDLNASGLGDPIPSLTDVRACLNVMSTQPFGPTTSFAFGGVYVTKAAPPVPATPAPPPNTNKSKKRKRAKAIAKCRKKYRKAKHRRKRAACIRKAKRRYRVA